MTATTQVRDTMPVEVSKPQPGDVEFLSVSTILNAYGSDALVNWAAEETARAAVKNASLLERRIELEGEAAVGDWLVRQRFSEHRTQRTATRLGQDVHDAIWKLALTGKKPAMDREVTPFVEQFDAWCQRRQPSFFAAELSVFDLKALYVGTADLVGTILGEDYIVDVLTSRRSEKRNGAAISPYRTKALQVAALRHAQSAAWGFKPRRKTDRDVRIYFLNEEERAQLTPMVPTVGGVVLHLTPRSCKPFHIDTDADTYEQFHHLHELARWNLTSDPIGAEFLGAA